MKMKKIIALSLICAILISLSANASPRSIGAVLPDSTSLTSSQDFNQQVSLLADAFAFAVGAAAGFATGVVVGFDAGTKIVNFLYGQEETISSFEDLSYSKADLSGFDPK